LKVRPAEVRPAQVRLDEVRPTEVRVPEFGTGEVRPDEVRLGEVRSAKVRPGEVRLAEVRPSEVRPSEVRPAELHPKEACLVEVRLAGVPPAEARPAEVPTAFGVPLAPLVPGLHALLEQRDVLVVRHRSILVPMQGLQVATRRYHALRLPLLAKVKQTTRLLSLIFEVGVGSIFFGNRGGKGGSRSM